MKLFVCLLLASVIGTQALTDEQKANWKRWSEECQTQTGVSQEAINQLRTGDLTIQDPKIKDHTLCFAKKAGLADDNGDLIADNIRSKLKRVVADNEEVERIITKCVVKKNTPEDTAFNAYTCLKGTNPNFTPV